jgi:hypothetical protein
VRLVLENGDEIAARKTFAKFEILSGFERFKVAKAVSTSMPTSNEGSTVLSSIGKYGS